MRTFYNLIVLVGFVFSAPVGYKQLTQGFRLAKLELGFAAAAEWEIPRQVDEREKIEEIFKQPFRYLDRGTQFYVFESEDGKSVIKFFRKRDRNGLIEQAFSACKLAYLSAREETGLLFIHLNATEGELPVLLIKAPFGRRFHLPLDCYSFALQKKAESFRPALLKALKKNEAEPLIESYTQLVKSRSGKGIRNTDLSLTKNFGFVDGKALEIDFGNYELAPEEKDAEFLRCMEKMGSFLRKNGGAR